MISESFRSGIALLLTAACGRAVAVPAPAAPRSPVWFQPMNGCEARAAVPPHRVSDTLSAETARARPDAAKAYAARRLPGGYASGPYPSPHGRGVLWMQEPQLRDSVLQRLAAMPGLETVALAPDSIDVRAVRWDSAALYDWMMYLVQRLPSEAKINGYGVDSKHRVSLMLEDASGVRPLTDRLEELGVPCSLVVFEVVGPISLM